MTRTEIRETIGNILMRECDLDKAPNGSDRFTEDLGLDSARLLILALEVENAFDLILNEAPEDPPKTIDALVELLHSRLVEEGRIISA